MLIPTSMENLLIFGPSVSVNYSVEEIVEEMSKYWEKVSWESNEEKKFNESAY